MRRWDGCSGLWLTAGCLRHEGSTSSRVSTCGRRFANQKPLPSSALRGATSLSRSRSLDLAECPLYLTNLRTHLRTPSPQLPNLCDQRNELFLRPGLQVSQSRSYPEGYMARPSQSTEVMSDRVKFPTAAIADIMPQTKSLETAMVEGQVLLVEPQGRTIVPVIAQEL
jgi:hypothetical protein